MIRVLVLTFCISSLYLNQVYGQDKIYLKTDSVIDCTIIKIGKSRISYYVDGIYTKASHRKFVHVSDTRSIEDNPNPSDTTGGYNWFESKRHAVKWHIEASLRNAVAISFETSHIITRSYEWEFGLIGLLKPNTSEDVKGLYLSGGYKFFYKSSYYPFRIRKEHALKGPYIKPNIILSLYEEKRENIFITTNGIVAVEEKDRILSGAVMGQLGRQFVIINSLVFDISVGIGIGYTNIENLEPGNISGDKRTNHYGFRTSSTDLSFALSTRLSIGLAY